MDAERGEGVEQRGASGVEAESIEDEIRFGEERGAQRKKAAEEISPGTAASIAWSCWGPSMETDSRVRSTFAPKVRSASSLWSRVRTDSRTVVRP